MIRKMQIADYSDVYNLWLANKGMGLNDVDDSESGIVRFLDRNPDTCFVAERDGRLVGVIMAGNDGRRGFILSHSGASDLSQTRHWIGARVGGTGNLEVCRHN